MLFPRVRVKLRNVNSLVILMPILVFIYIFAALILLFHYLKVTFMRYQIINFETDSFRIYDSFESFSIALVSSIAGVPKEVCFQDCISDDEMQVNTLKFS